MADQQLSTNIFNSNITCKFGTPYPDSIENIDVDTLNAEDLIAYRHMQAHDVFEKKQILEDPQLYKDFTKRCKEIEKKFISKNIQASYEEGSHIASLYLYPRNDFRVILCPDFTEEETYQAFVFTQNAYPSFLSEGHIISGASMEDIVDFIKTIESMDNL